MLQKAAVGTEGVNLEASAELVLLVTDDVGLRTVLKLPLRE
jgi:hypothetical protein